MAIDVGFMFISIELPPILESIARVKGIPFATSIFRVSPDVTIDSYPEEVTNWSSILPFAPPEMIDMSTWSGVSMSFVTCCPVW